MTVSKTKFKRKLSNTYCWLTELEKRSFCNEMPVKIRGTQEYRREFWGGLSVVQSNLQSKSGSDMQIRKTFDLSRLAVV